MFVRRSEQTKTLVEEQRLIARKRRFCGKLSSNAAPAFNQWANAALVFHVFGRQNEALASSDRALQIFPDSANLHFLRAKIFPRFECQPAEQEYRNALALRAERRDLGFTSPALPVNGRLRGRPAPCRGRSKFRRGPI